MSRLEILREHLGSPPSVESWQALIALFDPWSEAEDLDLGLAYAAEHLASWPDALRVAPPMWLDVLLGGTKNAESARKWLRGEREHPGLALCRSMDFGGVGLTGPKLKKVKKSKYLGGFTRLVAHNVYANARGLSVPDLQSGPN